MYGTVWILEFKTYHLLLFFFLPGVEMLVQLEIAVDKSADSAGKLVDRCAVNLLSADGLDQSHRAFCQQALGAPHVVSSMIGVPLVSQPLPVAQCPCRDAQFGAGFVDVTPVLPEGIKGALFFVFGVATGHGFSFTSPLYPLSKNGERAFVRIKNGKGRADSPSGCWRIRVFGLDRPRRAARFPY